MMREKYIEERFQRYFVFGEYADGFVDVACSDNPTVVAHISREDARNLIRDRDEVIDALIAVANGTPINELLWRRTSVSSHPSEEA